MIPDAEAFRIAELPQVAEAMPVKLVMTSCQSATDIIAAHGVDKQTFTKFRNYDLDDEILRAFREDTSGALLGYKVAERYDWGVGDRVTVQELDGISFNVKGIFSTEGSPSDYLIIVGRRFLQEATLQQGLSNQVFLKLAEGADPDETCEAVEALPLATTVTCVQEESFLVTALDQLEDLVSVSRIVILTIAVVTLIAIGNAISMATRERAGEIGILRTLGFQPNTVLALIVVEGIVQTLIGGVVGCLVVEAFVRAGVVETVSTCGLSVEIAAGWMPWALALSGLAIAGLVGSFLPAWRLSRVDIVEAIRRED